VKPRGSPPKRERPSAVWNAGEPAARFEHQVCVVACPPAGAPKCSSRDLDFHCSNQVCTTRPTSRSEPLHTEVSGSPFPEPRHRLTRRGHRDVHGSGSTAVRRDELSTWRLPFGPKTASPNDRPTRRPEVCRATRRPANWADPAYEALPPRSPGVASSCAVFCSGVYPRSRRSAVQTRGGRGPSLPSPDCAATREGSCCRSEASTWDHRALR